MKKKQQEDDDDGEDDDPVSVSPELLHTERAHLRNLKVLDVLFNRPMQAEGGVIAELAHALFPNIDEIITLHGEWPAACRWSVSVGGQCHVSWVSVVIVMSAGCQ